MPVTTDEDMSLRCARVVCVIDGKVSVAPRLVNSHEARDEGGRTIAGGRGVLATAVVRKGKKNRLPSRIAWFTNLSS